MGKQFQNSGKKFQNNKQISKQKTIQKPQGKNFSKSPKQQQNKKQNQNVKKFNGKNGKPQNKFEHKKNSNPRQSNGKNNFKNPKAQNQAPKQKKQQQKVEVESEEEDDIEEESIEQENDESEAEEEIEEEDVQQKGESDDEEEEEKQENEQEDDDEEEDEEIKDEQVNIDLQSFAQLQLKKQSETKKQKERKVMDFKFRVLDLLDIFIKKTENPEIFVTSLIPIFQTIKNYSKDKEKSSQIEKLSNIQKKFFEKNQNLKVEQKKNVEEIIKSLFNMLAKISKKQIQKTFQFALFSLIKIRLNMNSDNEEFKKSLTEQFGQSLQLTAQKREIYYSDELFKDSFKQFPEIVYSTIPQLMQYANLPEFGGEKEHRRKHILEILYYVSKIVQSNENYHSCQKELEEQLNKLIEGVFTKYNSIKQKKYSDLRKYSEILISLAEKLEKNGQQYKEKMAVVVESWEQDNNIKQFRQKLLQKLQKKSN